MTIVEPDELMPTVNATIERLARWSTDALRLTKLCMDAPAAAHPHVDLVAQAAMFEDQHTRDRLEAFVVDRRRRAAESGR